MTDPYLDHDTTEEDLAAQLPSFMPKDPDSGNYRFLATIAKELDALAADRRAVDRAGTPQHADTVAQLERLARLVDLPPERNEGREHYRTRVLAEYQLITSEGTVRDLLNAGATILDLGASIIDYTEQHTSTAGTAQLAVPKSALDTSTLSGTEFSDILGEVMPAGFSLSVLYRGTFTYMGSSAYSGSASSYDPNELTSDPDKGHDGLDTNGNPNDNGGTYAGLVE